MHAHTGLAATSAFAAHVRTRRMAEPTTKQQRRRAPGRALPRSEEELDRLAEIAQADYDATLAEVEPETRAALEAEEHEP